MTTTLTNSAPVNDPSGRYEITAVSSPSETSEVANPYGYSGSTGEVSESLASLIQQKIAGEQNKAVSIRTQRDEAERQRIRAFNTQNGRTYELLIKVNKLQSELNTIELRIKRLTQLSDGILSQKELKYIQENHITSPQLIAEEIWQGRQTGHSRFGFSEKEQFLLDASLLTSNMPGAYTAAVTYFKNQGIENPENLQFQWIENNASPSGDGGGVHYNRRIETISLIDATVSNFEQWNKQGIKLTTKDGSPAVDKNGNPLKFEDVYKLLDKADIQSDYSKSLEQFFSARKE